MKTSQSPCMIALTAYHTAQKVFPNYRHRFSPKKFTQSQLFTCLVLKSFFKTDYRGIVEIISEHHNIWNILELHYLPHYTTLQKASKRLLNSKDSQRILNNLLKTIVQDTKLETKVSLIDSTGFESEQASKYYVFRRNNNSPDIMPLFYKRYPKLSLASLPYSMFILTSFVTQGPSTDMPYFKRIFKKLINVIPTNTIIADAGYDKEANHILAHQHSIESIIPCRSFRKDRPPKSEHRLGMLRDFPKDRYGIRWHVETVMSMLKRNLGEKVYSHTFWSQSREIMLKVITHDVAIVVLG